jgi:hypothetical protein
MIVVELTTYHVPEDAASLMPVEGYMVAFAFFYKWGFGVPTHLFLHSLLPYYRCTLQPL